MQSSHTGNSDRAKVQLAGAFLFLMVLWTFLPAIHNDFLTYDDPEYVTNNPYVKNGLTLAGIKWAFSPHGANWHPVTWLSHLLDGQLFGLRPWGHHFTNVLLHATNSLLAFCVLRKLTGATWRSFAVALLFGLHPLRVESVAWVAERKDVLSVFFFLLAIWAYIFANKSRFFYWLTLMLFVLGLLAKSMLVTFPFVLLLLDYWPLQRILDCGLPIADWELAEAGTRCKSEIRNLKSAILEKLPFFLAAAAMCVIARHAQQQGTALVSGIPLGARIENALVSYCRYLGKMFWPADLSPFYPAARSWPVLLVCAAAILLIAISLFAILRVRREPWWFVGWFWYLATLVPVIGLIQIGEQSMADRYSYIPSLGILIAAVWGAHEWTKGWRSQRTAALAAVVAAAIACSLLTREQISYWRSTETLFTRAVEVTPDSTLACVGLGACLAERGDFDDAMHYYRKALKSSPQYFEAHNDLGLALAAKGRWDEAIAEYQLALQDRPGAADGHVNLGVALARIGRLDDARAQFERAVAVDPANVIAHSDLAMLQLQKGEWNTAIEQLRAALKHAPQSADLHNDLGTALARAGQLDSAITEFQIALKLDPAHPHAAGNLAQAQKLKNPSPATVRPKS